MEDKEEIISKLDSNCINSFLIKYYNKGKEAGRREVLEEVRQIIDRNIWDTENDGRAIRIQFNKRFEEDLTSAPQTPDEGARGNASQSKSNTRDMGSQESSSEGCGVKVDGYYQKEIYRCGYKDILCDECKQKQEKKDE
jgi:hypothetical protein